MINYDNAPQLPPLPITQNSYSSSISADIEPKKSRSKIKIFLCAVGILFLLGFGLIGYLMYQGVKDSPQVQWTITNFLNDVSSNNFDSAYMLTSNDFKKSTPKEDFIKAMSLFKAQYSGFSEQKQTGFSVETNAGQPTLFKYSGVITYNDKDQGELSAVLVKEDNVWKILFIGVNVNLKRLEKFQQTNKSPVLGINVEK